MRYQAGATKANNIGYPDRVTLRLVLFLCLGMTYAGFARYSAGHQVPVLCPFRRLTGLRCPLCGFTTATGHLLQGDLRSAVRAHPLALPTMAGVVLWYGTVVGTFARRRMWPRRDGA
jgi:hypothetical protein